jgi:hypothetical protein
MSSLESGPLRILWYSPLWKRHSSCCRRPTQESIGIGVLYALTLHWIGRSVTLKAPPGDMSSLPVYDSSLDRDHAPCRGRTRKFNPTTPQEGTRK